MEAHCPDTVEPPVNDAGYNDNLATALHSKQHLVFQSAPLSDVCTDQPVQQQEYAGTFVLQCQLLRTV